jgi:hypothetical protein
LIAEKRLRPERIFTCLSDYFVHSKEELTTEIIEDTEKIPAL